MKASQDLVQYVDLLRTEERYAYYSLNLTAAIITQTGKLVNSERR